MRTMNNNKILSERLKPNSSFKNFR